MIGETINRYKIIDKLGEGGMGTVWKAEDTTLGRLVALKTLSGAVAKDPEARERFVREAQAASALNHPNITTVHDLLEEDGQHLICMEYVEGKTVRDMVESGRVGVKKAVDIVLQTAEALETAHRQGILHRDIKSSNIMVTMEGRVKVLDFGLAHLEERSQLTRTGTTMGTLAYSAPEQLTGAGYDQRSEIWALGVVFYELLAARLPFSTVSEGELIFSIINNEQEPPSKFREDIPESVGMIILRMLEKDPGDRYQNCSELISDLKQARGSLETSTAGHIPRIKARRGQLKRTTWITLGALLITIASILMFTRSNYVPGSALVVQFLDGTGDDSLESLSSWGPDQIRQLLSESGLVSGVDMHGFEAGSELISAQQPLSDREVLRIAREHRADLTITASYDLEGEELVLRLVIHSRSRAKPWSLPPIRGSKSDLGGLMSVACDRIEGMIALIQDEGYRVLDPLIGYPPSVQAYWSMREGLYHFFSGGLDAAIPTIEQVIEEYPGYARPLLWRARWATWRGAWSDLETQLSKIDQRNLTLDTQEKAFRMLLLADLDRDREICYRAAKDLQRLAPRTYWNYEAAKWATNTQRPREAIKLLKDFFPEADVLRNSPDATRWMLSLAYKKLGRHKKAFKTIAELRKEDLNLRPILYYEVISLGAMGRLDEIEIRFSEAPGIYNARSNVSVPIIIGHYGGTPGGLMIVGGTRLREYGHMEKSRDALHQAIDWFKAQDPDFYKPSIAEAYYWAGEWEEAERLYGELAETDPKYHEAATIRLGTLAARTGDEAGARSTSEYLASPDQTNPGYLFWMACIEALLGNEDAAVSHLQSSLDQGLGWRDDIQLHIDLESLRGRPNFDRIFELKR